MKKRTERALLGHISWTRQMMERGIALCAQWRDTRDTTADGHTKWSTDRDVLLQGMGGTQPFNHDL
eukprot:7485042-Pyramimonas_sp.AAC.1